MQPPGTVQTFGHQCTAVHRQHCLYTGWCDPSANFDFLFTALEEAQGQIVKILPNSCPVITQYFFCKRRSKQLRRNSMFLLMETLGGALLYVLNQTLRSVHCTKPFTASVCQTMSAVEGRKMRHKYPHQIVVRYMYFKSVVNGRFIETVNYWYHFCSWRILLLILVWNKWRLFRHARSSFHGIGWRDRRQR